MTFKATFQKTPAKTADTAIVAVYQGGKPEKTGNKAADDFIAQILSKKEP